MNVGDILAKAGEIIDERGWCQHTLEDQQGRVCAVGALDVVLFGSATSWRSTPGFRAANRALQTALPQDFLNVHRGLLSRPSDEAVVKYNNAPGRTIEEVREWFAKAAMNEGITLPSNKEQQHA